MLAFGIAQVNLGGVTSGVEVLTGGRLVHVVCPTHSRGHSFTASTFIGHVQS